MFLKGWVVPTAGRADWLGRTTSLLTHKLGFGAVLGGVRLAPSLLWGFGRHDLVVDWEELEVVSSSLVKVPCLTRPGGD